MKARKRTNQPFTLATTLLCFVLLSHAQDGNKKDLHFSFITALTGSPLSSGGIPVIDFALEQINNDPRLLPNYNLKTVHTNSGFKGNTYTTRNSSHKLL